MKKNTEVIATRNSLYGARIKAGQTMRVSAAEADVLVKLGHARYAPKEIKIKRTYQRRDMVAEPVAFEPIAFDAPSEKA